MEKDNFEELLREYITSSRQSVRKLAAEVGTDRTLIQKYMSGSRFPKNWQEVERIASALMLSPRQRDRLAEAYYRSEYGDHRYQSFLKIGDLLQGNQDWHPGGLQIPVNEIKMKQEGNREENVFYGKLKVERAVSEIMIRECTKAANGEAEIRLILQPDQETFIRAVCTICSSFPVKLEHIFCLDRNRQDNDNISLLFSVFAFEFSGINYHSRYYYEDVESHVNEMNLLPNMLVSKNHVLLCNNSMDEGIVLRQEEQVSFFQRQYERLRQRTVRLSAVNQNAIDVTGMMKYIASSPKNKICISWFPWMTLVMDKKLCREHLLLAEKEREQFIHIMAGAGAWLMQKGTFCHYFAEEGLRYFMEMGCFPEYPQSIYRRPDRKIRAVLLERMIDAAERGLAEFHLSAGDKINMQNYMAIYVNGGGSIGFLKPDELYGRRIMIDEPSICETVCQFAHFAEENGWFMDQETSLKKMKGILLEYKE